MSVHVVGMRQTVKLVLLEEVLVEVASSARCWVLEAVETSALYGMAE